ncbi:uncharacterized protein A4U43_C02F12030 [Asparagus officinalis]|uniref:Uncharacterized protein n=1 Tax=Asparagus officinalis TaxID=4686 RepID=A0A5P1FKF7_ASPOF|nr:uncharacterized protein A4U43_C02F12030 [Asparagus officinalis]
MLRIAFEREISSNRGTSSEEEERVNYDTDVYFTDPDEYVRGDDAGGSSTSQIEAKPNVGIMTTTPSSIAKPSIARCLVSITDSSKSIGDVPIFPLPQGDEMGLPPRSKP